MNYTPELHDTIVAYLRKNLSEARYTHIIGTAAVARDLARRHGGSPERAYLAALLHDAAKGMPDQEMIAYVNRHRVPVTDKALIITYHPSLLHSFISAHIARTVFGVTDKEILDAIALHTVGGVNMSLLAKIVYISDTIAPDRRYRGVQKLRRLSRKDLHQALQTAMAMKITYVVRKKEWLHPLAVSIWNSLL